MMTTSGRCLWQVVKFSKPAPGLGGGLPAVHPQTWIPRTPSVSAYEDGHALQPALCPCASSHSHLPACLPAHQSLMPGVVFSCLPAPPTVRVQDKNKGGFKPDVEEEYEDASGNVYNKKTYEDMKRQGLL